MRLTQHQQELMGRAANSSALAGADIQNAKRSVCAAADAVRELIGTLEDPGERDEWSSVLNRWLSIGELLDAASSKFDNG